MAKYLLRLDDACPTADWQRWDRLEALLDQLGIRPIVAVIPDNRDETFDGPPHEDFWGRVKAWEEKGWTLAMHGLHHLYVTGDGGLVPINRFSEFAGLPLAAQRAKIRRGWEAFLANGLRPRVWVAPGHSFDLDTLRALEVETAIDRISDGLALRPFREHGFHWLPQQLWRFRRMPFGIWTICLHLDLMSEADLAACEGDLRRHRASFVPFGRVRWSNRPRGVADRLFAAAFIHFLSRRQARPASS